MIHYDSLSESLERYLMKQLTIRGMDGELERRVRDLARQEDISLNQAVLRLLRRGAGMDESKPARNTVGDSLDDLMGTWSEQEATAFREAIEVFERVDESLWQ